MMFKKFMDTKGYIYSVSQLANEELYFITRTLYHSNESHRWKSRNNILFTTFKEAQKNLSEQALKNGWFKFMEE
ncbi:hypothetical protein [Megamonas hypermegale]|uniref:hypothetical protein n=1 Tax=Megamonas hypermegale TaxID=158847 RepID=UPI0026EA4844|nr:hypothetical protein [Megamonas hypermegale]